MLELQNQATETPNELVEARSEIEAQVQRILQSPQFRNAAVLQSFLSFITARTIMGDLDSITEHGIAAEVFARGSTFDSSIDTIVRTQAYRLRLRLRDYYSTDGKFDPILIEVPKGHYVPLFIRNPLIKSLPVHSEDIGAVQSSNTGLIPLWRKLQDKKLVGVVLSAFAIFGLGVMTGITVLNLKHLLVDNKDRMMSIPFG